MSSTQVDELMGGERKVEISLDKSGLVLLTDIIPDALLEIRYFSTFNFVGERIDAYEAPVAYLTKETALALKNASDDLKKQGYVIEIFDAYRPQSAVDLTIVDMMSGQELDMGSAFDFFGEVSHSEHTEGLTKEQINNRLILRKAMTENGFKPLAEEWWHFSLENEPYPNTYFDFPITVPRDENSK